MNTTDRSAKRSRRRANSRSSTRSFTQRGHQRPTGLLRRRQFLTEPGHGAVEVMQLQPRDAVDAVVLTPLLAGTVRAGHHQPVQHGQEDGTLDGKREAASGEQFVQDRLALGVAP